MNRRMVFYMLGQIVRLESALLLLPLLVCYLNREYTALWAFAITAGVALAGGTLLTLISRPRSQVIFAKEGFVIVALAWLFMSVVGALPFTISGGIPSYVDAFFETVSGFTTTGSSILTDVESLGRGLQFWRSFTHWVGGMGVLVLIMAIVPSRSGRSMHILRAEMPGPIVGKLVPRVRDTAKVLYLIYIGMTVVQTILLLCGGMPLFDSLVYTFGTAGTGGFGIRADSVAGYSPYLQWVITVFMLLFGVNFNLYYLILVRQLRTALKSRELWCYLGIVLVACGIITANIWSLYETAEETIRTAMFQVSSIITTTGYATADYTLWPGLSKAVLFLLTFIGACAGSTGGGLKVSRLMLAVKSARRDLQHHLHHRSVGVVKLEGKRVDDGTVNGVGVYLVLYFLILAVTFLILSIEPFDMETNLSASVTCLNNVGPGFGAVGPAGNFAAYSGLSKVTLSFAMLFGRLEIYPLLFALIPSTWTKK
ncbi:MAG: TrkH family potassium uptake protein [Ruminococcaceae bacterium]|nr:TrkH family potassium uptake protein [Oscillospiraceae bacterium]